VPAHLLQAERLDGLDDGVAVVFRALLHLVWRAVIDIFTLHITKWNLCCILCLFVVLRITISIKTIVLFYFFPVTALTRKFRVLK